jgi:hypothetical protein
MTKLDKTAISTIVILCTLIGLIIFWGSRIPVQVTCIQPANCSEISSRGGMVFEFSRPVDPARLDSVWQITPATEGKWLQIDDRHSRWISTLPIKQAAQISFGFKPGVIGQENESIAAQKNWSAKIRKPTIIAINSSDKETELYLFDPEGKQKPTQLTHTGGKTFDYDVDPLGDVIVFTAINERNGSDIWKVNRDGSGQALLLNCGVDRCTEPVWSPKRDEIAYTRETSDPVKKGALGAPRIWMLNPQSGATGPLFEDKQQIGYGTSWSADGIWLSIWDGMSGGIKIVNRQSGQNFIVQSSSGNSGCWTVDQKSLVFANTIVRDTGYHNVILKVKVDDQSIVTLLGENSESGGTSFNNPQCNPVDDRLALTIQPNIKIPGRTLAIFDPGTQKQMNVVNDLSLIPGQYSWDAAGGRLVFQLDQLTSAQGKPRVLVWEDGKTQPIAEGFRFPRWLP